MSSKHFFAPDLNAEIEIPKQGILSRTLYNDDQVKLVLSGFSESRELSAHTAPMPASVYFLKGEGSLTLGEEHMPVRAGSFAHMTPNLRHAIAAQTPLVMLLARMKSAVE
jgi:quercetin dioxygenase-like cupin family protein